MAFRTLLESIEEKLCMDVACLCSSLLWWSGSNEWSRLIPTHSSIHTTLMERSCCQSFTICTLTKSTQNEYKKSWEKSILICFTRTLVRWSCLHRCTIRGVTAGHQGRRCWETSSSRHSTIMNRHRIIMDRCILIHNNQLRKLRHSSRNSRSKLSSSNKLKGWVRAPTWPTLSSRARTIYQLRTSITKWPWVLTCCLAQVWLVPRTLLTLALHRQQRVGRPSITEGRIAT